MGFIQPSKPNQAAPLPQQPIEQIIEQPEEILTRDTGEVDKTRRRGRGQQSLLQLLLGDQVSPTAL